MAAQRNSSAHKRAVVTISISKSAWHQHHGEEHGEESSVIAATSATRQHQSGAARQKAWRKTASL